MLTIDGSEGEGGGQILRSALSVALVTGEPFRMHSIRARRGRPGLKRQHLTALRAAAAVSSAEVSGAHIDSPEVVFQPRSKAVPRPYRFDVGSAGSTTLVLQTVLPALAVAAGPSEITLMGGTHNRRAPPFEFLDRAFLPLLGRMGPRVTAELQAYGFYPVGTGRLQVSITPAPLSRLARLDLPARGEIKRRLAVGTVADLSTGIARRELLAAQAVLGWEASCYRIETVKAHCPGNVITLTVESEHVTEVFTGFGEKGLRAEVVGEGAALEAKAYLDAGAAVGEHLADQLLLPMALAGGGSFRTVALSSHARTQMALLERLLGARTTVEDAGGGAFVVEVRGAG